MQLHFCISNEKLEIKILKNTIYNIIRNYEYLLGNNSKVCTVTTTNHGLEKTEIKERIYGSHGSEESVFLKYQGYPNWSRDLTQSRSKSQQDFFIEVDKLILKLVLELEEPRYTEEFWKKQKNIWRSYTTLLQDSLYSYNNEDSTVSNVKLDVYIDGIESLEVDTQMYGQLFFQVER